MHFDLPWQTEIIRLTYKHVIDTIMIILGIKGCQCLIANNSEKGG
jgi:hypothetical protein